MCDPSFVGHICGVVLARISVDVWVECGDHRGQVALSSTGSLQVTHDGT